MLQNLGYLGFGQYHKKHSSFTKETLDFTTAIPAEFNLVRSDTELTARNSLGNWVGFAANQARIDHDASGNPLGVRVDKALGNKVAQRNFAPTDTTGVTVTSGDGTAVLVNDATNLANATIDGSTYTDLQNGNVIELRGGTTTTQYALSDQVGNTNSHSWRINIASANANYVGWVAYSDGIGVHVIQNATINDYYEFSQENQAPNHPTRVLIISLSAGKTIRINATQLEEATSLSYPIVTNGAAVTTSGTEYLHASTANLSAFNITQGALIGTFIFDKLDGTTQYAMLAGTGANLVDAVGMYLTGYGQMAARDVTASSNHQNDHVHKPISGHRMPCAISWEDNRSIATAGPMRNRDVSYTASHSNAMNDIYLGARASSDQMSGWIKSLTIYDKFRSLSQLGADMFPITGVYKALSAGGQSNMEGWFRSTDELSNGGEAAAVTELDKSWTTTENWVISGGFGGSRIVNKDDVADDNWWYDLATDTFGPRMTEWKAMVDAFGKSNITDMIWDQGESDSNKTIADFKSATLTVLTEMRTYLGGTSKAYITGIGRRGGYQDSNYNNVRIAQRQLASENAWIYLNPEKFIQSLESGGALVHLADAGYAANATQVVDRIINNNNGPTITSASRAGTTVTVTLTHGAGTDFTPTTAIAGFHFYDDTTEIAVSAAVRTDATTITLTLASTPTGVETLYYGYGTLFDEKLTYTDLVIDNSTNGLPLMSFNEVLPYVA